MLDCKLNVKEGDPLSIFREPEARGKALQTFLNTLASRTGYKVQLRGPGRAGEEWKMALRFEEHDVAVTWVEGGEFTVFLRDAAGVPMMRNADPEQAATFILMRLAALDIITTPEIDLKDALRRLARSTYTIPHALPMGGSSSGPVWDPVGNFVAEAAGAFDRDPDLRSHFLGALQRVSKMKGDA